MRGRVQPLPPPPPPPGAVLGRAWRSLVLLSATAGAGVAPLRCTMTPEGCRVHYHPPKRLICYCVGAFICVTSWATCIQLCLMESGPDPKNNDATKKFVHTIRVALLGSVAAACFTAPRRMKLVINTCNEVYKIERELDPGWQAGAGGRAAGAAGAAWALLAASTATSLREWIVLQRFANDKILISGGHLMIIIQWNLLQLVYLQFTLAATSVTAAMRSLNNILKKMILSRQDEESIFYERLKEEDAKRKRGVLLSTPPGLRRLAALHARLRLLVQALDRGFGPLLLLTLSCYVYELVSKPYIHLRSLNTTGTDEAVASIAIAVANILFVVEVCHRTQEQVAQCSQLLVALAGRGRGAGGAAVAEAEEARKFARQIRASRVGYAPFGLFIINRELLISLQSLITTNAAVLLAQTNPDPGKKNK